MLCANLLPFHFGERSKQRIFTTTHEVSNSNRINQNDIRLWDFNHTVSIAFGIFFGTEVEMETIINPWIAIA